MAGWSNDYVPVTSLPRIVEDNYEPLAPGYRLASTIARLVAASVVATVGATVAALFEFRWITLTVTAVILISIAIGTILFLFEFNRRGFQLRDHDLSFRSGLLLRSIDTVPFCRVQLVSVSAGVIERRFGLKTLLIRTSAGDQNIAGLPADVAEEMRQFIITRATELGDYDQTDGEAGDDTSQP